MLATLASDAFWMAMGALINRPRRSK